MDLQDPSSRFHAYLKTSELLDYLGGISRHKLRELRYQRGFPEPFDVGGVHLYRISEIDAWLDRQRGDRA